MFLHMLLEKQDMLILKGWFFTSLKYIIFSFQEEFLKDLRLGITIIYSTVKSILLKNYKITYML